MMSPRIKYWICIALSFLCSATPPVVQIAKKYPLWTEQVPPAYTVSTGAIVAIVVVLVCFRKTLVPTIMDKLGIKSIPPVVAPALVLVAALWLEKLTAIIPDIKAVALAWLFGSAIGWVFSLLSSYYDKQAQKEVKTNGNGND